MSLSLTLSFFFSDGVICFIHQSARHGRGMMCVGLYHSFSSSLTLRTKQTHLLLKISACAFASERRTEVMISCHIEKWNDGCQDMTWWASADSAGSQPIIVLFSSLSHFLFLSNIILQRCLEWDGPWRVWFCAVTIKLFKRFKPHSSLPNPTSHYSAWNNGVVQIWCENNEIEVKVYWH